MERFIREFFDILLARFWQAFLIFAFAFLGMVMLGLVVLIAEQTTSTFKRWNAPQIEQPK